jgi:hypothetical protein
MTDFFLVAVIVAFFAAAALLVRVLDRVVAGAANDGAANDDAAPDNAAPDAAPAGEDDPWPAPAAGPRRPAPAADRR